MIKIWPPGSEPPSPEPGRAGVGEKDRSRKPKQTSVGKIETAVRLFVWDVLLTTILLLLCLQAAATKIS